MKFGTGSITELTQKREGQSTKMPYVCPNILYKQTNIPDFQLCYPCKCLARYARSPITIDVLEHKWRASLKTILFYMNDFDF